MELGASEKLVDSRFSFAQIAVLKNFFLSAGNMFKEGSTCIEEYLHISQVAGHVSADSMNDAASALNNFVLSASTLSNQMGDLFERSTGHSLFTQGKLSCNALYTFVDAGIR